MTLADNLIHIKEEMSQASHRHEPFKDVTLVAVTKSVSSSRAKELVSLGVTHLAENRAELFLEKQVALQDEAVIWHLIGTLQTRKIKDVINSVDYFHALDRLKTAKEIQKRATKEIKCFVQVNVSGEASKQGVSLEEAKDFILQLESYTKIRVVGLMTMAPIEASEAELRVYFRALAQKQAEIAALNLTHAPCQELSMGMSQDFQIAIEEGATFIRVGSKLFRDK